jgi:hypothetical protein
LSKSGGLAGFAAFCLNQDLQDLRIGRISFQSKKNCPQVSCWLTPGTGEILVARRETSGLRNVPNPLSESGFTGFENWQDFMLAANPERVKSR